MAVARILVSRLLSADERAALAHHHHYATIGSSDASRWAELVLGVILERLIEEHRAALRDAQPETPP